MSFRKPRIALLLAAASATLLLQAPAALAINFGDMMSPGRWMGGNNNDDDYYDYRGYGPYVPPPGAYGVPPYGAPYGAYGATPYGGAYGAPYGAPSAWAPPANPAPAPAPSQVTTPPPAARTAPATPNTKSNEIDALKRRIEELEARKAPPPTYAPPPAGADRGAKSSPATGLSNPSAPAASAPTFRPMDKY